MSINTIVQKPNQSLHIYVYRYNRLHYATTDRTVQENTDPMRIYHFVTSINKTSRADKIAKQVWYILRTLQEAFHRALTLEAGLHLAKGVHIGRSPQVMQVSTSASYHHDKLKGCVHQAMLETAKQDLMLVGSVEDWPFLKGLQGYPKLSRW